MKHEFDVKIAIEYNKKQVRSTEIINNMIKTTIISVVPCMLNDMMVVALGEGFTVSIELDGKKIVGISMEEMILNHFKEKEIVE